MNSDQIDNLLTKQNSNSWYIPLVIVLYLIGLFPSTVASFALADKVGNAIFELPYWIAFAIITILAIFCIKIRGKIRILPFTIYLSACVYWSFGFLDILF